MKVVTTFHQPSSVTASLKCHLSADSELGHLVVARSSHIEVSSLGPEGLTPECTLDIWGRALSMRAVPVEPGSQVSNILILTDHPDPRLLLLGFRLGNGVASLVTLWANSLQEWNARPTEFFTDIVVDPSGEIAIVSCYVGKLKLLVFKEADSVDAYDLTVPELNILSITLLHMEDDKRQKQRETQSRKSNKRKATDSDDEDDKANYPYQLAIVHIDHRQRTQLIARGIDPLERDLSPKPSFILPTYLIPSNTLPDTETPPTLVSIPPFALAQTGEESQEKNCLGGVLLLGGRKLVFVEVANHSRQQVRKDKQKRLSRTKKEGSSKEIEQAKVKEEERDSRKIKPSSSVKWPWGEITAWCYTDHTKRRILLGDAYGKLSLLTFSDTLEMILLPLGEVSPPTTLSYLSSGVLYVGSHLGNSQLVHIHASPVDRLDSDTLPIPAGVQTVSPSSLNVTSPHEEDIEMAGPEDNRNRVGKVVRTKGNFLEILESYRNIAPILDAVLADTEDSGQPHIITCSGGTSTGSLNILRTGADFKEQAILQGIPDAVNLFPIRADFETDVHNHVLVSTLYKSHLLRFEGRDSVTHVDSYEAGLITDSNTIALSNVSKLVAGPSGTAYSNSSFVIQVTPKEILLVEFDSVTHQFNKVDQWNPSKQNPAWGGREIIAADINPSQVLVALNAGGLVLLNIQNDKLNFKGEREVFGKEISAVSIAPFDPTKKFSLHAAVAFWETRMVSVLSLKPADLLMELCESTGLSSVPRSVLIHNFGPGRTLKDRECYPYVVAGLADGNVACLKLQQEQDTKSLQLRDYKLLPLGVMPVSLIACNDGQPKVLVSGSRTGVLHWEKQRLSLSTIPLKNVTTGAPLNTTGFRASFVLATPSSLLIGSIKGAGQTQVRTVPFGLENPRRITYHSTRKIFGVATVHSNPARVGEADVRRSSFKLLDGISLNQLSSFTCDADEDITAVQALIDTTTGACFCVGSVRYQHGELEPSLGSLFLFGVNGQNGSAQELTTLLQQETDGCVYALTVANGMIAAAINTAVDLYTIIRDESDGSLSLKRTARWNHSYFVTSLVSKGDTLIAGDAISSVSVLKVVGNDLQTVARDYGPLWPIAIEAVKNDEIVGANSDCNLFTFALRQSNERKILERSGNYYIGDVVNKFVPGGLSSQDYTQADVFESEQMFFTSSGRIGVVAHVNEDTALHLTKLQRNLGTLLKGPGGIEHSKWRAPVDRGRRTDVESSFGFLDGDFLEQFLTHPEPAQVLTGKYEAERIALDVPTMNGYIEKLHSLR